MNKKIEELRRNHENSQSYINIDSFEKSSKCVFQF